MVRATGTLARDERLSAYLDGELPGEEAETLESELALDPDMRSELEGLRQVADGLNALGEVRAPRSFTIVAMQVPRVSRLPRLEFATRLGAAVAAVALLVVVAGDRLVDGSRDAAPLAATAAQSEMAAAPVAGAADGEAGTAEEAASTAVAEPAAPSQSPAPQDAATEDTLAAPAPPSEGTSAAAPARAGDAAGEAPVAPTPEPAGTPLAGATEKAAGDDGGEAAEVAATTPAPAATAPPAAGAEETVVAAAPEAVEIAAPAAEADGAAFGPVQLVEVALLAAAALLAGATIVQLVARRR